MPEPPTLYEDLAGRPRAVRKADMQIAGMGDFRDQVPASLPEHERIRRNYQQFIKHYYRVLLAVDENVGGLLVFSADKALAKDTTLSNPPATAFSLAHQALSANRRWKSPAYPSRRWEGSGDGK